MALIVFAIGLLLASWFDWTQRRVPNWLNLALLAIGIGGGWLGLMSSVPIWQPLVALVCLLPFFYYNVYRGGDVKLLVAASVWMTFDLWLIGFAVGMSVGGMMALLNLRNRTERERVWDSLLRMTEVKSGSDVSSGDVASTVPMALAFAAGLLGTQTWSIFVERGGF